MSIYVGRDRAAARVQVEEFTHQKIGTLNYEFETSTRKLADAVNDLASMHNELGAMEADAGMANVRLPKEVEKKEKKQAQVPAAKPTVGPPVAPSSASQTVALKASQQPQAGQTSINKKLKYGILAGIGALFLTGAGWFGYKASRRKALKTPVTVKPAEVVAAKLEEPKKPESAQPAAKSPNLAVLLPIEVSSIHVFTWFVSLAIAMIVGYVIYKFIDAKSSGLPIYKTIVEFLRYRLPNVVCLISVIPKHIIALRSTQRYDINFASTKVLLSVLESENKPIYYALLNSIPRMVRGIQSAEEFNLAMEMGIRLARNNMPPCDIIEVGVPLASELAGGNLARFASHIQILEASENLWVSKTASINWRDIYSRHHIHREFIRRVVPPIIRTIEDPILASIVISLSLDLAREKEDGLEKSESEICPDSYTAFEPLTTGRTINYYFHSLDLTNSILFVSSFTPENAQQKIRELASQQQSQAPPNVQSSPATKPASENKPSTDVNCNSLISFPGTAILAVVIVLATILVLKNYLKYAPEQVAWHHKISGAFDPFTAGLLLLSLRWLRVYTMTDIIKAISWQQRKVGFVDARIKGIETKKVDPFEAAYCAHRDPKHYQQGVSLSAEPKNAADMLLHPLTYTRKYGIYILPLLIKRLALDIKEIGGESGTRCNLCPQFMPLAQRGFSWRDYRILINPFTWTREHGFVLAAKRHTGEETKTVGDEEVLNVAFDFVAEAPGVSLFLNGPARSIPEHFHFQGCLNRFSIEAQPVEVKEQRGAVSIGRVPSWPVDNTLLRGKVSQEVKALTRNKVEEFIRMGFKPDMLDILLKKMPSGEFVVFIYPRVKRAPDSFYTNGWGVPEMSGYTVLIKNEEFKNITPDLIANGLREVGQPQVSAEAEITCCNLCGSGRQIELFRVGPIILAKDENIPLGKIKIPGHGYRADRKDIIVRCGNCGLVYVRNPRVIEWEPGFYQLSPEREAAAAQEIEFISRYLGDVKKVKMADVGCGFPGHHLKAAAKLGFDVEGIDTSREAVGLLTRDGLKAFHGTLHQRNFESNSLDLLGYFATLEHLLAPSAELAESRRVLKDGGLLYITRLPNLDSEVGRIQGREFSDIKIGHFYYFSPKTLRMLFEKSGFEIVHLETKFNERWVAVEHEHGLISDADFQRVIQNKKQIEAGGRGELVTVIAKKFGVAVTARATNKAKSSNATMGLVIPFISTGEPAADILLAGLGIFALGIMEEVRNSRGDRLAIIMRSGSVASFDEVGQTITISTRAFSRQGECYQQKEDSIENIIVIENGDVELTFAGKKVSLEKGRIAALYVPYTLQASSVGAVFTIFASKNRIIDKKAQTLAEKLDLLNDINVIREGGELIAAIPSNLWQNDPKYKAMKPILVPSNPLGAGLKTPQDRSGEGEYLHLEPPVNSLSWDKAGSDERPLLDMVMLLEGECEAVFADKHAKERYTVSLKAGDKAINFSAHRFRFLNTSPNRVLVIAEGPFNPTKRKFLFEGPQALSDLAGLLKNDPEKAAPILEGLITKSGNEISAPDLKNTAAVLSSLLLVPVAKSEEICRRNNLSVSELLRAYRMLRSVSGLHQMLINNSEFAGVAGEIEFQLQHCKSLEGIFDEKTVVYPLLAEFHPGTWCPYKCVYCYTNHNKDCPFRYQDSRNGRKPLTAEKARELVREFAKGGTEQIWVSGGLEPLTTDIAWHILDEANRLGLRTKLYTNGQLLAGRAREVALESGWVRFSISAIGEEMFRSVHRPIKPEFNFKRVENNIRELVTRKRETGFKVEIGLTYLVIPEPSNYRDILKAADWAYNLGVDFLAVRVDMGAIVRSFNPVEIAEILRQIVIMQENARSGKYNYNKQMKMGLDLRGMTENDLRGDEKFLTGMPRAKTCQIRMSKMVVNPFGVGFLCDYLEHPLNAWRGDFEVGDFSQASVEAVLERSKEIKHDPEICKTCGIKCLIHEQIVNTILEKLKEDRELGIALGEQPFMLKNTGAAATVVKNDGKSGNAVMGMVLGDFLMTAVMIVGIAVGAVALWIKTFVTSNSQSSEMKELLALKNKKGAKIIALMGYPASGKSTVASYLVSLNYRVIDTEHEFPKNPRYREIMRSAFKQCSEVVSGIGGKQILVMRIDRKFRRIFIPAIAKIVLEEIRGALVQGNRLIIVDCAFNHILGLSSLWDEVWYIRRNETARKETVLARFSKFGMTKQLAEKRFAKNPGFPSERKFLSMSNQVIDNNGSTEKLKLSINGVLLKFQKAVGAAVRANTENRSSNNVLSILPFVDPYFISSVLVLVAVGITCVRSSVPLTSPLVTILTIRDELLRQEKLRNIFQDAKQEDVFVLLRDILGLPLYRDKSINVILPANERLQLIATVCSAVLKRKDAATVADFLERLIKDCRMEPQMIAEAKLMVNSYLSFYRIRTPVKVATVISVYGHQLSIQKKSEFEGAEDAMRNKILQLQELFSVNPLLDWQLIYVQDGDDRKYTSSLNSFKTTDLMLGILRKEFTAELKSGRICVFEVDQSLKEQIQGCQGSGVLYGMRKAVQLGAGIVIYTNVDLDTHVGLEGNIIKPLMEGSLDLVIGSNRVKGRVLHMGRLYYWYSIVLNRFIRTVLPVGHILDTHNALKGVKPEMIDTILPVSAQGDFEKGFDYFYTSSDLWISRAKVRGYRVGEVPSCMHHSPRLSVVSPWLSLKFFIRIWRQRKLLDEWKAATRSQVLLLQIATVEICEENKVRVIAKDSFEYQERLLQQIVKTKQSDKLLDFCRAVLSTDRSNNLAVRERFILLRMALALSLKESGVAILSMLGTVFSQQPEAKLLFESYRQVSRIAVLTKISTVMVLSRPEDHARSEYLRTRLEQLEDLYGFNPNVKWELIVVHEESYRNTPAELWQDKIKQECLSYAVKGQLKFLEIPWETCNRLGGRFGPGATYGMAHAIKGGADYVIYGHIRPAIDLALEGIILRPTMESSNNVGVASKFAPGSILQRGLKRNIGSYSYNWIVRSCLPRLSALTDTQCPFKAFSRDILDKILPVTIDGIWDNAFDYWTSFDTNLLGRADVIGARLIEAPVIFKISQREGSRCGEALRMVWGLVRQRNFLWQFRQQQNLIKQGTSPLVFIRDGKNMGSYLDWRDPSRVVKIPKRHYLNTVQNKNVNTPIHTNVQIRSSLFKKVIESLVRKVISINMIFRILKMIQQRKTLRTAFENIVTRILSRPALSMQEVVTMAQKLKGLIGDVHFYPGFRGVRGAKLYCGPAFSQQYGVISLEGALRLAVAHGNTALGRILIDEAFGVQEQIWQHGYFNWDTDNILIDTMMTSAGCWILVDFSDMTEDINLASQRLLNAHNSPFYLFTLLTIEEFSLELAQYYRTKFEKTFTTENLQKHWKYAMISPGPGDKAVNSVMAAVEDRKESIVTLREVKDHFAQANIVSQDHHILLCSSTGGRALRQGLLGLASETKGDIVVLGKRLTEITTRQAEIFSRVLPSGHWFVWLPADAACWLTPDDIPLLQQQIEGNNKLVVLGMEQQERQRDPPLSGFYAAKTETLNVIGTRLGQILSETGNVHNWNVGRQGGVSVSAGILR
ncbi:MAG: DUF4922 domain-containing protein [Candidatus Omnitrophica bacterium]|nr:DUF4922 domain-containing protein [Candidatus Omnitrophota bacterium]